MWEAGGATSAEALTAWVSARSLLTRMHWPRCWPLRARACRKTRCGHYDAAIEQLSLAGAQAGILNSVAADKAVRDQAQMEAQRVAMAGSALEPESRGVRRAGGDQARRSEPGDEALRGAHTAGLSAGRRRQGSRLRATACRRCTTRRRSSSLEFSRNIQEGGKTIEAAPEELEGLPADISRGIRHKRAKAARSA